MRTIEFRGMSDDGWVYGNLIDDQYIVGEMVDFTDEYFNTTTWCRVYPGSVGQYTGLKDKYGNRIYEGDIVRFISMPMFDEGEMTLEKKVVFDEGCFWVEGLENEKTKTPLYVMLDPEIFKDVEVIGNIYENPELLEVGAND